MPKLVPETLTDISLNIFLISWPGQAYQWHYRACKSMPQLFWFFNKTECDLFKMIAFRPPPLAFYRAFRERDCGSPEVGSWLSKSSCSFGRWEWGWGERQKSTICWIIGIICSWSPVWQIRSTWFPRPSYGVLLLLKNEFTKNLDEKSEGFDF